MPPNSNRYHHVALFSFGLQINLPNKIINQGVAKFCFRPRSGQIPTACHMHDYKLTFRYTPLKFPFNVSRNKWQRAWVSVPLESDDNKEIADQGGADVIPEDVAYGAAWETEHGITLNQDQRACCLHGAAGGFWVPLSINRQQNHRVTKPLDKIHKATASKLTPQSRSKVKVKRQTGRRKQFFSECLCSSKDGSCHFLLSLLFQMFHAENDLNLEESVSAENVSIMAWWEGARACWGWDEGASWRAEKKRWREK